MYGQAFKHGLRAIYSNNLILRILLIAAIIDSISKRMENFTPLMLLARKSPL